MAIIKLTAFCARVPKPGGGMALPGILGWQGKQEVGRAKADNKSGEIENPHRYSGDCL